MNKIIFPTALKLGDPANLPTAGKSIGELQSALLKLKLEIKPNELARKEMGASTVGAVRAYQTRADLPSDGRLTPDTVAKLNAELAHNFVVESKTRTQRMQELLLQSGQQIAPDELKSRKFGSSTQQALTAAQTKLGIAADGRVSKEMVNKLREDALKAKLGAKTQVAQVQRTLMRALNIAKLKDVRIDAEELKGKQIGPSTQAAIKAVQTKYGLPATGQLDAATFDRLTSIAVSIPEPVRRLKARSAAELKLLKKNARLNMKGEQVGDVQGALAFLGFKVDESEFKNKAFGKSTRDALVSYQQARGLAVTGHAAGDTLESLNREIQRVNPAVAAGEYPYRIRGSVRDDLWQGMPGVTVQIWEKLVSGQGAQLAERKTGTNGFFDIPYDSPREAKTKQIKQRYYLQIKAIDGSKEIGSKLLFNPTQIAWANFTKGDQPYRGKSQFQARMTAVTKAIGSSNVANLVETVADRQISRAAQVAGLVDEEVMRLVLAHRVAAELKHPQLGAEACYAFIAQNLPPQLSEDLINIFDKWEVIDDVVDSTTNGLVFMEDELTAVAFDNAITLNLMPIKVGLQKDAILAALAQLKQTYALEKPILVGNGSLRGLLDLSTVAPAHHSTVASAFLKYKSFGPDFWADANTRPADFGGADAIKDLKTTVEIGHVTNNFKPMLKALKQKIADDLAKLTRDDLNVQTTVSARDLAKLSHDEWVGLINANNGQVPPNTDGQTTPDKVQTYAATLVNQSERMFPDVALVATVARSANSPLKNVKGVQALMDAHPDLDLRSGNLDIFVKQQPNITIDDATLTEARVLQRVHRIAPTAAAGQVLLDNKIHSSAQIIAMGKDQFVATLTRDRKIDSRTALTVYGFAEYQYAQVLQRIADYRFDLHRADPKAIVDHTYNRDRGDQDT